MNDHNSTEKCSRPGEERCWCGGNTFDATAHADYLRCRGCGTAKMRSSLGLELTPVSDESSHLYGEHYWDEHMVEQGYAPFAVRARHDLVHRDQLWLTKLLKYRLPSVETLEIGCAPGAFVKLLQTAGYRASGMEMSPAVIAKARKWFDVNIVPGPIENATGLSDKYDVVLMFDVLEHFPDPTATMRTITDRIAPDGLLVLQTPNYDDVTGPQWHQFKAPEHTYLFGSDSLKRFLSTFGFVHVSFEPAIFDGDMFAFASRQPLTTNTEDAIAERLMSTPNGRLALALQDLHKQLIEAQKPNLADRYGVRALGSAFVQSIPRAFMRRFSGR